MDDSERNFILKQGLDEPEPQDSHGRFSALLFQPRIVGLAVLAGNPLSLNKEDIMKRLLFIIAVLLLASFFMAPATAEAKIQGKTVSYRADGIVMKGYLVYDTDIQGQRPGVLVVHEAWGLNDYARKRARMLAEMGYTALAVDMYGGGNRRCTPLTGSNSLRI